jgi:hypothetical protein
MEGAIREFPGFSRLEFTVGRALCGHRSEHKRERSERCLFYAASAAV